MDRSRRDRTVIDHIPTKRHVGRDWFRIGNISRRSVRAELQLHPWMMDVAYVVSGISGNCIISHQPTPRRVLLLVLTGAAPPPATKSSKSSKARFAAVLALWTVHPGSPEVMGLELSV